MVSKYFKRRLLCCLKKLKKIKEHTDQFSDFIIYPFTKSNCKFLVNLFKSSISNIDDYSKERTKAVLNLFTYIYFIYKVITNKKVYTLLCDSIEMNSIK